MKQTLEHALSLRKSQQLEESNQLLLELLQTQEQDAYLNYQVAWSFDLLEKEKQAVAYYERAIALGLEPEDLKGAFIGLGSTYRCIGEYQKAKELLEKAAQQFPDEAAIKTFYAMTLYNLQQYSKAMEILLTLLAETAEAESIQDYQRAILFYADKLNEKW